MYCTNIAAFLLTVDSKIIYTARLTPGISKLVTCIKIAVSTLADGSGSRPPICLPKYFLGMLAQGIIL